MERVWTRWYWWFLVLFPMLELTKTRGGPVSWLVSNQSYPAFLCFSTLEMYKFFKTKTIKRKMMKFCLSIPGDRSVSNFNKSASGESQNIMAEYVIESWKCQLENFWRVSNMDDQLYFWQLKDIWVLIPKAELDREGELTSTWWQS